MNTRKWLFKSFSSLFSILGLSTMLCSILKFKYEANKKSIPPLNTGFLVNGKSHTWAWIHAFSDLLTLDPQQLEKKTLWSKRQAKTQVSLRGCAGWSESTLVVNGM